MAINIFFSPGDVLAGEALCQDGALLEVDHQKRLFSLFDVSRDKKNFRYKNFLSFLRFRYKKYPPICLNVQKLLKN